MQKYYQKHFPCEQVCELLARKWRGRDLLDRREVCVETGEFYCRWQSVSDAAALRKLFAEKRAEKVHTGAVFSNEPRHRKRKLEMSPLQRELVFDIDVNDVEALGIDSSDIEACDRAWPLVAFQMKLVKNVLREQFGFQHFMLVYSGRRGAHLSVYDERACVLSDEARSAIVAFLQPDERDGKLSFARLLEYGQFRKLYETHVEPVWRSLCVAPAGEGGLGVLDSPIDRDVFMDLFGNEYAKRMLNLNGISGREAWERLLEFAEKSKFPDSTLRALRSAVLHFLWPRLDANVTKLRNHLSKSVFSVHPKTGRVCVPVCGEAMRFAPEGCPTLEGVVSGKHSLEPYVVELERFTKKLKTGDAPPSRRPT